MSEFWYYDKSTYINTMKHLTTIKHLHLGLKLIVK